MKSWTIFQISMAVFVVIFSWEVYVAENVVPENLTNYRFSFVLEQIAHCCIEFFTLLGRGLAWISSYLWQINWMKIVIAVVLLFMPIWKISTSWVYIGTGYVQYAVDYAIAIPSLYTGSALLILVAIFVVYKYYISVPVKKKTCGDATTTQ